MMKLGTQTASLVNNLYSRGVIGEPVPEVGMGCTLLGWSDRYPATIVSVVSCPTSKAWTCFIEVTDDDYKVVKGSAQDGSAEYEFSPKPDGYKTTYGKSAKTGFWFLIRANEKGRLVKADSGNGIRIGQREKYQDPSF